MLSIQLSKIVKRFSLNISLSLIFSISLLSVISTTYSPLILAQTFEPGFGDFDDDGDVGMDDILMFYNRLRQENEGGMDLRYDFNHDGVLNLLDGRALMGLCNFPRCIESQPIALSFRHTSSSIHGYSFITDVLVLEAIPIKEHFFDTVEFSFNGVDWHMAVLRDGIFTYDIGRLSVGYYSLYTRLNAEILLPEFNVWVRQGEVSKPLPVSMINLPDIELVEKDFIVTWDTVDDATFYKLYIDGVEAQQLDASEAMLNFPTIGSYNIQVEACNIGGCSELSPEKIVTIYHTELNFNDYVIDSYADTEDMAGTVELVEGGRGIRLQGNVWKQIPLNYTVSVHTVLAFDFISSEQGQIHGIGLSTDLTASPSTTFALYGEEDCCITDFKNYSGDGITQHYEIMIGQYYRGEFEHLFFIMDEDRVGNQNANGTFRAVRFYEEERVPAIATGLDMASATGIGQNVQVTWDNIPEALRYKVNVNGEEHKTVDIPSAQLSFELTGKYIVGIQSCNDLGCNVEAESQLIEVFAAPNKVTALETFEQDIVQGKDFNIKWYNINEAENYTVFIDGIAQAVDVDIPVATLNLTNSGDYNLQVQACSRYGCGEISDNLVVTVVSPPGQVKNISSLPIIATSDSTSVSWEPLANTDYYEITVDGQFFMSLQTSSTEIGFSQPGTYTVAIRGCNIAGCGVPSMSTNITSQAPPSGVFGVTIPVDNHVGEIVNISWLPVPGATYYEVYLDDILLPTVETSQAKLNITFDGIHTLHFKACGIVGCSVLSAAEHIEVVANHGPIAKDTSLNVTQLTPIVEQDLALLISDVNGIDWSTLQFNNLALGKVQVTNSTVIIDYTNVNLDGQERLEYQVNDLLGAPSNKGFITLNVVVLQTPDIPEKLSVDELSPSDELAFTWQTPEGADIRYHVEHQLDGNPWQVLQEKSAVRAVKIFQATNGSHRFKVKACRINYNQCSDFAQSIDFIIANPPSPVKNILSPTVNAEGQIRLQWLASNNATYYNVEQQNNAQGWVSLQQNIVGTMLLVNSEGNGQFEFKVTACNTIGCSAAMVSPVAVIANIPEAPAIVNIIEEEGNGHLNWSEVELADWYLIQTEVSGEWQGINGSDNQTQYYNNSLLLTPKPIGDIKVLACNNVGCSPSATLAINAHTGETPINAFYPDMSVLASSGHETSIHWIVNDAANVSIISDQGDIYRNLPAIGSLMIAPKQTAHYTLNAQASVNSPVHQQSFDVVVTEPGDDVVTVLPSEPSISPIVSSILVEPNGNRYFGDLQGSLVSVNAEGDVLWKKDNTGILYSPPVLHNAKMYFSATANDGKGKFCRIDMSGYNLHCLSLPQSVIGAPIIDDTQAWVVDLYGGAININLVSDNITSLGQLPAGKQVRSTPVRTLTNVLVVSTTGSDIYKLDLNAELGATAWILSIAGEQQ